MMRLHRELGSLFCAASVLVAAPLGAQGAPEGTVRETLPFDPDGYVRIHAMAEGEVTVRAWDRDSVAVEARMDAPARAGWFFGAAGTGAAKLGVEPRGAAPGEPGGRAEIDVRVPAGARVWIKTLGAAIRVSGVGGALDLYSVTGAVDVEGDAASLTAETMGGAISVDGVPRVARLRSGAGDITVRGGGPDMTVHTVSGRLTVQSRGPLRRLAAETVGGAVRIEGTLARGGSVSVTSHDGPVELALPAATDAEFLLVTLEGEIQNRLTPSGTEVRGLQGRERTFTAGSGGADVTVRTFSGAITLRAAEPKTP